MERAPSMMGMLGMGMMGSFMGSPFGVSPLKNTPSKGSAIKQKPLPTIGEIRRKPSAAATPTCARAKGTRGRRGRIGSAEHRARV